jgi:hypothetical protein
MLSSQIKMTSSHDCRGRKNGFYRREAQAKLGKDGTKVDARGQQQYTANYGGKKFKERKCRGEEGLTP